MQGLPCERSKAKVVDVERIRDALAWLGFFDAASDMPRHWSLLDSFTAMLVAERDMHYGAGERDLALMHHEVTVREACAAAAALGGRCCATA